MAPVHCRSSSGNRRSWSKFASPILLLALIIGAFWGAPVQSQGAVSLLYFKATAVTDHVLIEWETAVELNVVAFCVQRSLQSGGGFLRIADCLPAKGDGISGASYSLIDTDVVQGTMYYYRLEVVGSDGASEIMATAPARVGYRTYLPLLIAQPSTTDSFWADRYRLGPGECTVLHWSVTNAREVYLNAQGVPGQGTQQVCPAVTQTYVLRVARAGGTQEYRRTIVVGGEPWIGVDADGHFYRGNPNITVKLEEFMDFQCPYCARHALQTGPLLYEAYIATGEVLQVFHNFPLDFHPNALPAAKSAYCAGQQAPEYFWSMYDWLFKNQETWGPAADASVQFRAAAVTAGADGAQYDACIANPATEAHIQGDLQEGAAKGVSGTPYFFIDNCRVFGAQPVEQFQEMIEKAKKGLCRMTPPPQCPDLPLAARFDADPARPGFTYDGSPTMGAVGASLVMVSFEDFKSAGSAKHARTVEPILRSWYVDPGQLRLVYEPFADTAPQAATAALCAAWQGKFGEYRNLLYQKQAEWQEGDGQAMLGYASSLGLDVEVFSRCLTDGKARAAIDCALKFGQEIGVPTTPSFLLIKLTASGEIEEVRGFAGVQTLETFVQAIQELTSSAAAATLSAIPRFPSASPISFETGFPSACRIRTHQEAQAFDKRGRLRGLACD
jgi:protein-disulfide isomerase